MKDQVVGDDKLSTTTTPNKADKTTTIDVTSKYPQKNTPEFSSVTLSQPTGATSIEYTPVDKNGNPTGKTEKQPVTDDKKPTELKFPTPQKADGVKVVIHYPTDSLPTPPKVVSSVVCLDEEGKRLYI